MAALSDGGEIFVWGSIPHSRAERPLTSPEPVHTVRQGIPRVLLCTSDEIVLIIGDTSESPTNVGLADSTPTGWCGTAFATPTDVGKSQTAAGTTPKAASMARKAAEWRAAERGHVLAIRELIDRIEFALEVCLHMYCCVGVSF